MVPVVIKLWHQRCLFSRVRPKGYLHQGPCPAQRGITLSQPFPEFNCFGVRLYQLINKPAPLGIKTLGPRPCSLPPNAGNARRRFCSKFKAYSDLREIWLEPFPFLIVPFLFFFLSPFSFLPFSFFGYLCKHKNSLAARPAIIIIISLCLSRLIKVQRNVTSLL